MKLTRLTFDIIAQFWYNDSRNSELIRLKNKIAVFDLDDTIGNFRESACNSMNQKYNKHHTFHEWEHHLIEQLYDIDKDQFMQDLISMNVLEKMVVHYEAKNVIDNLKNNGYYIVILTARQWHPQGKELTEQWLHNHGIAYDELILCNIDDSKSRIVGDRFKSVDFVVDDSPYQIEHYWANKNIKNVYTYDMPWNRNKWFDILGCKRIKTLEEISV